MAVAVSIDTGSSGLPDATGKEAIYQGTLTFSGSYTTGGDTLSFATVSGWSFPTLSQAIPNRVEVYEQPASGQTATAYIFIYALGTTIANGKLQIFSAQGTQFAAGAYGSTFANTVIKVRAWFPRGQ